MTREDEQLLLKDLCGRLPYGVKIKIGEYSDYKLIGIITTDVKPIKVEVIENDIPYSIEVSLDIVKIFLRPMSSMTEDELAEFKWLNGKCDTMPTFEYVPTENYRIFHWLNRNHFDYRGLIPKGLALEAPDGMYNNKVEEQQ